MECNWGWFYVRFTKLYSPCWGWCWTSLGNDTYSVTPSHSHVMEPSHLRLVSHSLDLTISCSYALTIWHSLTHQLHSSMHDSSKNVFTFTFTFTLWELKGFPSWKLTFDHKLIDIFKDWWLFHFLFWFFKTLIFGFFNLKK